MFFVPNPFNYLFFRTTKPESQQYQLQDAKPDVSMDCKAAPRIAGVDGITNITKITGSPPIS